MPKFRLLVGFCSVTTRHEMWEIEAPDADEAVRLFEANQNAGKLIEAGAETTVEKETIVNIARFDEGTKN